MTGVSGSGKSSLAFDTIYAEGQRRYVESLSAYARQFLERMEKPDVDRIDGICPAIAIRQKNSIRNPRSTVGTTTEIHDYMRLLFARVGRTFCRNCGTEVDPRDGRGRRAPARRAARRHAPADRLRHAGGRRRRRSPSATSRTRRGRRRPTRRPTASRRRRSRCCRDLRRSGRRDARGAAPQGLRPAARRRPGGRRSTTSTPATLQDRADAAGDRRSREGRRRRSAPRLTDSIETAYLEGGGAAFAIESPDGGEPQSCIGSPSASSAATCGIPYEDAAAAAVLVQQPVRRLPDLPRLRQHHRARHGPGRARSVEVDPAGRDRAVEQAALPRAARRAEARGAEAQRAARRAVDRARPTTRSASSSRATATTTKASAGFFRWLERKKYKVHVRVFLSRYRGYLTCPDCGGARLRREARDVRVGGATIDVVCGADRARGADASSQTLELSEKEAAIADKVLQRDPQAAGVPERRRPRLPDARSAVVDAVGRRGAAHQPGDLARLGAGRHALRARRAVDRPALARQPAADRRSCGSCATRATPCSSSSTTPT